MTDRLGPQIEEEQVISDPNLNCTSNENILNQTYKSNGVQKKDRSNSNDLLGHKYDLLDSEYRNPIDTTEQDRKSQPIDDKDVEVREDQEWIERFERSRQNMKMSKSISSMSRPRTSMKKSVMVDDIKQAVSLKALEVAGIFDQKKQVKVVMSHLLGNFDHQ